MDKQGFISVLLLMYGLNIFMTYACNLHKAELCASQQQRRYDSQRNAIMSNTTVTEETRNLCLSTLKEDNITRCYHDNSKPCDPDVMTFLTYQWQENENDTKSLCNNVCDKYEELAECEGQILYSGLNNSQWEAFCASYNTSMGCAKKIISGCKFDLSFYEELIQGQAKSHYKNICLTGCINLDETMQIIEDCWTKYGDGITNQETTCQFHKQFETCLYLPDKVCREVNELVSLYYDAENTTKECKKRTTTPLPKTTVTTTSPKETTTVTMTTLEDTTTVAVATTEKITTRRTSKTKLPTTTLEKYDHYQTAASGGDALTNDATKKGSGKPSTSQPEGGYDDSNALIRTCLQERHENLSSVNKSSISLIHCSDVFTLLACLYNFTSETRPTPPRLSDMDVPTVVKNILTPETLLECSLRIQTQVQEIRRLTNASCSTGQREVEEDVPVCNGHSYGLIKCRNGSSRSKEVSIVMMSAVLWLRWICML